MQSFMPIHSFVFKIQTIKNGFASPKSFRGFRETGPWTLIETEIKVSKRNMQNLFLFLVHVQLRRLVKIFNHGSEQLEVFLKFKLGLESSRNVIDILLERPP